MDTAGLRNKIQGEQSQLFHQLHSLDRELRHIELRRTPIAKRLEELDVAFATLNALETEQSENQNNKERSQWPHPSIPH